jgi:hypothetical protein
MSNQCAPIFDDDVSIVLKIEDIYYDNDLVQTESEGSPRIVETFVEEIPTTHFHESKTHDQQNCKNQKSVSTIFRKLFGRNSVDKTTVSITTNPVPKSFESIRDHIRPLDLIFVKSSDVSGKLIALGEQLVLENDEFTHVGLVINKQILRTLNPQLPRSLSEMYIDHDSILDPDRLYLWEAQKTGNKNSLCQIPDRQVFDVEGDSEEGFRGVHIRPLDTMIEAYHQSGNKVAWGQLIDNPLNQKSDESSDEYEKRLEAIKQKLNKIHKNYFHRSYEKTCIDLVGSLFECFRIFRVCIDTDADVFCSEFIAIIYKELNILDQHVQPNNVVPVDLSSPTSVSEKYRAKSIQHQIVRPVVYIKDPVHKEPVEEPKSTKSVAKTISQLLIYYL